MRIWKWDLELVGQQRVNMPIGTKLLAAQLQRGELKIWGLCNEAYPLKSRVISVYGTGNPMPDDPGEFVGTFQMSGGSLVFHVFDLGFEDLT